MSQPIEISFNVFTGTPLLLLNFIYDPQYQLYDLKYLCSANDNTNRTLIHIPPRDSVEFVRLFPTIAGGAPAGSQIDTDSYAHINKIFLAVDARSSDSNYSIMYRAGASEIGLNSGVFFFGKLKSGETKIYSFRKPDATSKAIISINRYSGDMDSLKFNLYYKADVYRKEMLFDKEREVFPNYYSLSENDILLDLTTNLAGAYRLHLWNSLGSSTEDIEYSIVLNTKDTVIIPFNSDIQSSLSPFEWRFYETYIPEDGVLSIELRECLGACKNIT